MSRKKNFDFPEIGNISTLEYYNLLLNGKRATRYSTKEAQGSSQQTAQKPPVQKQVKKKPKKDNSSPYKKKKNDELVPPSPPEEIAKLKYLYGCVYGDDAIERKVWIEDDTGMWSGVLEKFEEVQGEDMLPVKYYVGGKCVDLRDVKAYLSGEFVEYQGKECEVLWNFPPPLSYPEVLLKTSENKIVNADIHDLRQPRLSSELSAWIEKRRDLEVHDSNINSFYFRFLSMKNSRQKVLLLRKHEVTGKYFVYKDKQFRWINSDKTTFFCNKTEPSIPFNLLASFVQGQNLRKLYKNYFMHCEFSFPKIAQEDKQFRKQTRCKICEYILDVLEYKQCEDCQSCYHTQCLDPVACRAGFRNLWRCPDCPRCENCLGKSDKLLRCMDCNNYFHEKCVDSNVLPTPGKLWKCELCAQCMHCKIRPTEASVKWNENITKCTSCDSKWKKGEYCSICLNFWFSKKGRQSRTEQRLSQNDDPEMIECDKCKMWVHLLCETSMTPILWQQFTADKNMKYFCPKCNKEKQNAEMLQIINQLIDLEKNGYFIKKIDEAYYSKVIKNPMFFESMIDNAKEGVYFNNTQLLRDHFTLLCENAMHYLKANTDGYKAAKKLLDDGTNLLDMKFMPSKRKKPISAPVQKKPKYESDLEGFNLDLPISLDTPEFYEFSIDLLSSLPPVNFHPALTIIINKLDIQPFMGPKPLLSFYPDPVSVSFSDPVLCLIEQCYICASFIQTFEVLVCRICSRAFHGFCITTPPVQNTSSWRCRDCRVCEICNSTQDAMNILYCKKCEKGYDVQCLWPNVKGGLFLKDWVCDKCFKCERCSSRSYHKEGFNPSREDFFSDFSLCFKCKWVVVNKDYCPECGKDWSSPYDQDPTVKDKVPCRSCEYYFHPDCARDWKNVCSRCNENSFEYSRIEHGTVEKVQTLINLMSQSNVYQILAKQLIQNRYKLDPDLANLLANFFLVDNYEFMTTNNEIKNFFNSRGVEVVRKTTKRKPQYENTRVGKIEGLRASEIPPPRSPLVRMHRPKEFLQLWNIEWDTSAIILSLNKVLTPLDNIEVVEVFFQPKACERPVLCVIPDYIWDFEDITDFMDFHKGPENTPTQRYDLLGSMTKESFFQSDEMMFDDRSDSGKYNDVSQEVLMKEYSHEQTINYYIGHEFPASLAFIRKFESWLKEHLLDITQHIINTAKTLPNEEEKSQLPQSSLDKVNENIQNDMTKSLFCVLCKEPGEKLVSGRLIPCEDSTWVHVNCAFWSSEVRIDEHGVLLNFHNGLSRGKKTKCKECGKVGATINCGAKKCHNSYHFPCALTGKVTLLENKGALCEGCSSSKDSAKIATIDFLISNHQEKYTISRSKKQSKKPNFIQGQYNRIGSVVLSEISSEKFLSYRLAWVNGTRKVLRCERKNGLFSVGVCCSALDMGFLSSYLESSDMIKSSMENPQEICSAIEIEDLWPSLKKGESFVLKSSGDFFGINLSTHYSPIINNPELMSTVKENKTILEKISNIKPSVFGASRLAPYTKHKAALKASKSHISQKSAGHEEQLEGKSETSLVSEYRKYTKAIDRDSNLDVKSSNIHGLGLFTLKDVSPGKIVVEYIGEIIRNRVADMREKEYELKGIGQGSCYLFRLDEEHVIDATVKGGKARFINHSCQPNCAASVCDIEGSKHILLFAKRFIHKGEEITYDYNFDVEEDKISCQCGSKDCQGKLN